MIIIDHFAFLSILASSIYLNDYNQQPYLCLNTEYIFKLETLGNDSLPYTDYSEIS